MEKNYEVMSATRRSVYRNENEARKKLNTLRQGVLLENGVIVEEKGVIAFRTLIKELNGMKATADKSTAAKIEGLLKRLQEEDIVYV